MPRLLFLSALLIAIASAAGNGDYGTTPVPKQPAVVYQGGGRTGGDTIANAVPIPALPFSDSGNTCGYANDYDEVCPYGGSTSPDVVYSFTPGFEDRITVDLCASQYDTKVYIYAGGEGNLIACNDDASCGYSGWQSKIWNVSLITGTTYYVVVDGYGGSCGDYALYVSQEIGGCSAWYCPPGALEEGEPECYDGYHDDYNGGCNSTGWTEVWAQAEGSAVMCGKSGTYSYQGQPYRDTDWFTVTGVGGPVVMECCATFPLQIIFIWGANCDSLQYDLTSAGILEPATLSHDLDSGQEAWLWVGASVFEGVPCSSQYVMEVSGIAGPPPVPAEPTSWGTIKASYRR